MKSYVARFAVMAACATVAASASAQTGDWGNLAIISSTMGNNANRICIGEGLRTTDIGCPSYAPSITTAGDVSVTGNLSANKFIGDGSLLTGVGQSDRIVSGTTNAIAWQDRSLTITTAGTQRMIVGENGNVGIGTDTPGSALSISGTGQIRLGGQIPRVTFEPAAHNTMNLWNIDNDGSWGNLRFFTANYSATGSGTGGVLRMVITSTSQVGIGTATPAATLQVSGSLTVSTSAQTTTPSLYVGTNGNVGIGTSAPTNVLDVISNSVASIRVQGVNYGILNLVAGANAGVLGAGTGGIYLTEYNPLPITFATSSTERMRIDASGRIGIGTASPGSSLTIVGEAQVGSSGAACVTATNAGAIRYTGGNLQYCNASNTWSTLGAAGAATAASNTGAIQFNVANALAGDTANLFWDDTNNRLGIGTSSPAGLLTVSGTLGEVTIDSNGAVMSMTRPGINYFGASQNAPLYLMTSNTGRIIITGLGNVGIGTSAPSATLTVSGSAIVSGTIQVAGAATEICTTGKLGTIRFNPVTGAPQICVQR